MKPVVDDVAAVGRGEILASPDEGMDPFGHCLRLQAIVEIGC
jgi:hypothetical protein